jgi:hypothetical protein
MRDQDQHRTSNSELRTPNGLVATFVRFSTFNVQRSMFWLLCFLSSILFVTRSSAQTNDQRSLVLVIGAAGEPEYAEKFAASAELWKQAADKGRFRISIIGQQGDGSDDRVQLLTALTNETAQAAGELWLAFIGHGTFDGRAAKFNLRGPDVTAEEMAAALKSSKRPLAVIQCASASGPFLNALSGPDRIILTATRSGHEVNATRFGDYFARAVADPAADLDKDGQTSLLEAYLLASREVEQFYKEQGRLATEHALLDDNGDGLGTPAEWFRGVRAVKSAEKGKAVDGIRAHQLNFLRGDAERQLSPELRARRDELEQRLTVLRARKADLTETDYYGQLESVLVEIARLYQPQSK